MGFKIINKVSTLDSAIRQIKDEIKSGRLKPSEKLPSERDLAIQLGISRASVRETIKALYYAGYLEVFQGKGTCFKTRVPHIRRTHIFP